MENIFLENFHNNVIPTKMYFCILTEYILFWMSRSHHFQHDHHERKKKLWSNAPPTAFVAAWIVVVVVLLLLLSSYLLLLIIPHSRNPLWPLTFVECFFSVVHCVSKHIISEHKKKQQQEALSKHSHLRNWGIGIPSTISLLDNQGKAVPLFTV